MRKVAVLLLILHSVLAQEASYRDIDDYYDDDDVVYEDIAAQTKRLIPCCTGSIVVGKRIDFFSPHKT